jgi:hypothetical protein
MYMRRLDPFTATLAWAIDAILGGKFLVLLIPELLEFDVEEPFNMSERDVVLCAAFGRHMLRVGDRECENADQAVVAHNVTAWESGRLGDWSVGHTC